MTVTMRRLKLKKILRVITYECFRGKINNRGNVKGRSVPDLATYTFIVCPITIKQDDNGGVNGNN